VGELLNAQCQVKDKREVGRLFDRDLNWAEYFRVREIVNRIKQYYSITSMVAEYQTDLEAFVMRNKKGCKRYRNVLTGRLSSLYVNNNPVQIEAGRHIRGGLEWNNRDICEVNYKVWTVSHLDAKFKDFLFKLIQGRLYLNQQLARFAEVERWCTFCGIEKVQNLKTRNIVQNDPIYRRELEMLEGETAIHLFWECRHVNDIIKRLCNVIANTDQLAVNREKYLCGFLGRNKDESLFNVMVVNALKFVIYKCKQRMRMPTIYFMKSELEGIFGRLRKFKRWSYYVEHISTTVRILLE
jgi:hypothetical protein